MEIKGTLFLQQGHWATFRMTNIFKEPRNLRGFKFEPALPDSVFVVDIYVGKNSQSANSSSQGFAPEILDQFMRQDIILDQVQGGMDISLQLVDTRQFGTESPFKTRVTFHTENSKENLDFNGDFGGAVNLRHALLLFPKWDSAEPSTLYTESLACTQVTGRLEKVLVTGKLFAHLLEKRVELALHKSERVCTSQDIPYFDEIEYHLVTDEKGQYLKINNPPLINVGEAIAAKYTPIDGNLHTSGFFQNLVGVLKES